jgi:anti-sigma B factor antagonist
MQYMSCPRCGLTVPLRASFLTLKRCPRCVAIRRLSVPMVMSPGPGSETGGLVIRSERDPAGLVLALYGELDLASAPRLDQRLRDAQKSHAQTSRPGRVVVDLSGLEFCDSAGLHVLLDAHRRLSEGGQALHLRRGPRAVQRMFELTQTTSTFRFED